MDLPEMPEEMKRIIGDWDEAVDKKATEIGSADNRRLAMDLVILDARATWLEEQVQALQSEIKLLKNE